jgi:hypothetical protein
LQYSRGLDAGAAPSLNARQQEMNLAALRPDLQTALKVFPGQAELLLTVESIGLFEVLLRRLKIESSANLPEDVKGASAKDPKKNQDQHGHAALLTEALENAEGY